jgi:thiamine-phosphate pyrophosphorylase
LNLLQEVLDLHEDINIIALGGIIDNKQTAMIAETKAYAFASIRYFI